MVPVLTSVLKTWASRCGYSWSPAKARPPSTARTINHLSHEPLLRSAGGLRSILREARSEDSSSTGGDLSGAERSLGRRKCTGRAGEREHKKFTFFCPPALPLSLFNF